MAENASSRAAAIRHTPIEHALAPHYAALRKIRRRAELERSPLWAEIGAEVVRVVSAVEEEHRPAAPRPLDGLRVVAWNLQRGQRLDELARALATAPALAGADVLLLVEVDLGLARSGNRNVARELAGALGLSYAFGVSYLVLEDDFGENPDGKANGLALAGTAILSRVPIRRVENVDLPELRDKFSSSEKRLGKKRALLCELELTDGPLVVAACHLDSSASPAQRAAQLAALLARTDGHPRALVGGDLNTTTYDLSSPLALARNVLRKLIVDGFAGAIEQYMCPERYYERPIFAELARRGFTVDGFNDRACGTLRYDMTDAYALQKSRALVGDALTRLLVRRLRPWGGVVPARLDWFAGRGLAARAPAVVDARGGDGRPLSDHAAIVVELAGC
jgi:endonuclease/exonuclease/phosphatase family metal-dependent hydrolase